MELWDAYNEDGTLAGVDLVRGERIPEGLRHVVVEVFVKHKNGNILLTKRDFNKPGFPGLWESGAGGSVIKGETIEDGARRELREETGIVAGDMKQIYYLVTRNAIHIGYSTIVDIPVNSIVLQEGETIDYRWMSLPEFKKFMFTREFVPTLRDRLRKIIDKI